MSFSSADLGGVLPVFQTPYAGDETIDWSTLESEIDWLYACGSHGIVMAMVSEVLRLDSGERQRLAEAACRLGGGRGSVVISVGAESAKVAETYARHAETCGASAVMAIPPVSIAPGEDELVRYYQRIVAATTLPVIVQDASGYVGRPMSIAMQARLMSEFGEARILFKPEAAPIGPRLTALREATHGKARIFEGTGGIALIDSYRRGIVGTMPAADLIRAIVAMWNALRAGDDRRAYRISLPLSSLIAIQSSLDGFLAVEKYLPERQGIFKNTIVRGPVSFTLDDETKAEVNRLFDLLMIAVDNKE